MPTRTNSERSTTFPPSIPREPATAARRRCERWKLLALLLFCILCTACPACRTQPERAAPRIAPEASAALARAQAHLRERGDGARDSARVELERALAIEPRWVAPQRLLDELAREDLRGVEVLARHRDEIARDERDAAALYLAGRLEGRAGEPRFERAVRVDPSFAWGWHGLSWSAQQAGELEESLAHARRALALAADPRERTFFTQNLARLLTAVRRYGEAAEVLAARSKEDDVAPHERVALAVQGVLLALRSEDLRLSAAAYERGLELLAQESLAESEVLELVPRLRDAPKLDDPEGHRLLLALSACSSPARDRLRAELLLDASPTPLALGLLDRESASDELALPGGALLRAARFWSRDYAGAVERWLAELPRVVLDDRGAPREPALAEVVAAARALAPQAAASSAAEGNALRGVRYGGSLEPVLDTDRAASTTSEARRTRLAALGEALVAAGWFREARAVAAELAEHDLSTALALDARALAGIELVQGISQQLRRVDFRALFGTLQRSRRGHEDAWRTLLGPNSDRPVARDLDEVLASLAPVFARANRYLGGETDVAALERELVHSPRLSYAPVGELVHPGPLFSAGDARDGLGAQGAAVGGLSAELARIGRFALLGEVAGGGGPDGTMLPTLWTEPRAGEHLGVRWSGTIAWCEAAEAKSRAGRAGARISAAAVHEGYWLDVDAVREELAVWRALARAFAGADGRARARAVLAERGLALPQDAAAFDEDVERLARSRRSSESLLGEAQRVRLAVLVDRAGAAGELAAGGARSALGSVGLDELVAVTATHEEGHLCDRTRFLPLTRNLPAALAFALECGFSPQRIQEMLEYRAQLTALCDVADPRIPLAQVLDSADATAGAITPHAAGYARMLDDLLAVLDGALARDPKAYPEIDRERTLVHQLHALGAEEVRGLALELARKKRLPR